MRTRILVSLAAGAVLSALAPAAPAQAQAFGQNLFSRIFGSGDDEAPAINYSERAPIVIPPKRDMRQPADPTALAQDPAWPKDPDEKKRRKQKVGNNGLPIMGNSGLMSQEELAKGKRVGPSMDTDDRPQADIDAENRRLLNPLNPRELQKKLHLGPGEAPLVAGVEPPRRSLVDPPSGLRVPLATAPLGGDEPLPSQAQAANLPWYKRWLAPQD